MILNEFTQLPEGWAITTLGDVVEVLDSRRIPLNAQEREKRKGMYPYYGANSQVDSINDYLFDGDYILIAEDGGYFDDPTRGVAYKVTGKFWVNNHAHIVSPLGSMSTQFFVYVLNTINWMQFVSGTTRLKLTQGALIKVPLSLPPLNEQRRIVAKLEALRARSQRVKEALEAIPPLLDQFRQSVLAAAFRGDLTADWREKNPDVEPASELLKRATNQLNLDFDEETNNIVANKKLIPDNWTWAPLKLVIKKIQSGKNFTCPEIPVTENTIGLVKISAVTWDKFNERETKTVIDESKIEPSLFIKKGDFLISRANTLELVGASVVVENINYRVMISDKVWRVTFWNMESRYINLFLKSKYGRKEIESLATGNQLSMRNLSQNAFRSIIISIPPLQEQQEIVRRVSSFFKAADVIRQQYQETKANLDQLDQSILAKAFRGELVPQDPNDEPASVLLERIRAERAKLEAQTKTAKKPTTQTDRRRTKKEKQQDFEPVQLELPVSE